MMFAGLLLLASGAMAQVPRDAKTLACGSLTFQSLMNAPLTDVRQDLAATLYALKQFAFITESSKGYGCLGRPEARYYPVPLLLGYIENRWISDSLGEQSEPVATPLDALRQEMRRQEAASSPQADAEFEARRQLSLQRSFAVEVRDQSPAADEIDIDLRNISSWTMRLYPNRTGSGGSALQLWFEPTEGVPVKFQCLDAVPARVFELASGQQVSMTCHRYPPAPARSSDAPSSIDPKGRWTLHRAEKLGWLTTISAMDVSVSAGRQALERADALVARSTCSDRGSCAMEKEIGNRGQSNFPIVIVLGVVFVLVVGLLLPRFSAYVLGPAVLVLAGVFVVVGHRLFVPFQSDGSPAGLLVPAIAWIALLICCGVGVTLIVTGRARIKSARPHDSGVPNG
jgi:hypothetical protein